MYDNVVVDLWELGYKVDVAGMVDRWYKMRWGRRLRTVPAAFKHAIKNLMWSSGDKSLVPAGMLVMLFLRGFDGSLISYSVGEERCIVANYSVGVVEW